MAFTGVCPQGRRINRWQHIASCGNVTALRYRIYWLSVARGVRLVSAGRGSAGFGQAVVISGHMTDSPGRTPPRFPQEAASAVRQAMDQILAEREVGRRDLAITSGARGADIIGAELCLARGVTVWLLLPLPEPAFLDRSVRQPGSDWEARFRALKGRCTVRYQQDELGPPGPGESPFARNNQWCLDLGRAAVPDERLFGLVVWDERSTGRGGGASDFAAQAAGRGIPVEIVNPLAL